MLFVLLGMGICGRLTCECDPWAFPILVAGTSLIGVGVAVVQFGAMPGSSDPGSRLAFGACLAAGALTGAAYVWLTELWDGMLKNQAKSKTAALMERPFAWFV